MAKTASASSGPLAETSRGLPQLASSINKDIMLSAKAILSWWQISIVLVKDRASLTMVAAERACRPGGLVTTVSFVVTMVTR